MDNNKLDIVSKNLSPERPIRSPEFLRGRENQLDAVVTELKHFHAVLFVYGNRGVGKTSLARTAAQLVTGSDREHIYVACAPGAKMLQIFREIGEKLLQLLFRCKTFRQIKSRVELEISYTPAIRASFEEQRPTLDKFDDANAAIRVLKELDDLLPGAETTVVVLDELEELDHNDRTDLAYLIKQLGDQEFRIKFILVGIADNVQELIGAHGSVPRYLKEVGLQPLDAQSLMDIVKTAGDAVSIQIPREVLYRIAIIGNGFPHFAHLMGKALLTEAILREEAAVGDDIYKAGVARAVGDSFQELRIAYETAIQRSDDYFKHLIWAFAHSDLADVRIDEWLNLYRELARQRNWVVAPEKKLRTAIGNFTKDHYGKIIMNTPARLGVQETRYRYKRFRNNLMRGHVRLQAENEGVTLGWRVVV